MVVLSRKIQGTTGIAGQQLHQRLCSRSTTASCSPSATGNSPKAGVAKKLAKPRVIYKTGKAVSPKLQQQQVKRQGKGGQASRCSSGTFARVIIASGTTLVSNKQPLDGGRSISGGRTIATPFIVGGIKRPGEVQLKAGLWKSPGGTDYIVTPGRHRIEINDFMASFDDQVANGKCPRMRGTANYAENMHRQWLENEKVLDPEVFMLSYASDSPAEKFRQMAIQSVFNYAVLHDLHENTIHLTVLNINRLLFSSMKQSGAKELTIEVFACTVMAALRNAIKMDESYEKMEAFRLDPNHIWRASSFLNNSPVAASKKMNRVEAEFLSILREPANPPLAPEFLERYLHVGNWPEYRDLYQELGSYLLGMALFSHGETNSLHRIPHSKLAAAALVLAVKIINTDQCCEKYEFWPSRLVEYTGYTLEDLRLGIRGLAKLLRNKPELSHVLGKYYTKWGTIDWS